PYAACRDLHPFPHDALPISAAGGLTFDGGILQVTGTSFTTTGRAITWGNGGGGFDIASLDNTFTLNQSLSGTGGLAKLGAGTLVDRKSTRLNSSHVKISYAV